MINTDKHLYFEYKKGADIDKVIEKYYLNILGKDEEYHIQGNDIMKLLDLKPQYFNKIFDQHIKSIYMDKEVRSYINIYYDNYLYGESNKTDIIKGLKDSVTINNKVAYSEKSLRSVIKEYFYIERTELNEEGIAEVVYDNITEDDINDILEYGVSGTTTLKEKFGVKYDMQLYRILRNEITHKKYVIIYNLECQHKRLARYLLY